MLTTVKLDDQLLACAEQLCGPLERSSLLTQALQALVRRESAKRLAALGGSESGIDPVRCTPTNRAFSHCLFTCSFSITSLQPASQQIAPYCRRKEHGWHGERAL
jgi:hypothetical protein